ncbi:MAG: hypothetical protein K8Q89_10205 [Nitrosarchaeum sp.]|nr:hypothetical protein [Nitrosarchaeum sp.]
MTKKDSITWHVNDSGKVGYIKKEYRFGKYRFHDFANRYFDLEKYDEEFQHHEGIFEPDDLRFCISWDIDHDDGGVLKDKTKKELIQILNLLSLQTNRSYQYGQFDHTTDSKPNSSHIEISMMEKPIEISEMELQKTVELFEQKEKLDPDKIELIERAIDWFGRGIRERDLINAFINYWIGFEILSNWIGNGSKFICPNCEYVIFPSSIKGRCKEFLELTKITHNLDELYGKRNGLVHSANPITIQNRNNVRDLLKESILFCLGKK